MTVTTKQREDVSCRQHTRALMYVSAAAEFENSMDSIT